MLTHTGHRSPTTSLSKKELRWFGGSRSRERAGEAKTYRQKKNGGCVLLVLMHVLQHGFCRAYQLEFKEVFAKVMRGVPQGQTQVFWGYSGVCTVPETGHCLRVRVSKETKTGFHDRDHDRDSVQCHSR